MMSLVSCTWKPVVAAARRVVHAIPRPRVLRPRLMAAGAAVPRPPLRWLWVCVVTGPLVFLPPPAPPSAPPPMAPAAVAVAPLPFGVGAGPIFLGNSGVTGGGGSQSGGGGSQSGGGDVPGDGETPVPVPGGLSLLVTATLILLLVRRARRGH